MTALVTALLPGDQEGCLQEQAELWQSNWKGESRPSARRPVAEPAGKTRLVERNENEKKGLSSRTAVQGIPKVKSQVEGLSPKTTVRGIPGVRSQAEGLSPRTTVQGVPKAKPTAAVWTTSASVQDIEPGQERAETDTNRYTEPENGEPRIESNHVIR